MKKRALSIVCAVVLVASMVCAGVVFAFGDNNEESSALVGLGVKFDSETPVDETKWTASGDVTLSSDKTIVDLATGDTNKGISYTYSETFNLTEGFTLAYKAGSRQYTSNYSKGYVKGVQIGNLLVALKEYGTPAIVIDGEEVALGEVIGKNSVNFNEETGKIVWMEYKEYLHSTGKNFVYKATFDAETKTLTFGAYIDDAAVANVATYTDTEGKLDFTESTLALYTTDQWDQHTPYIYFELNGKTEPVPEPDPGPEEDEDDDALVGLGLSFDASTPIVADDWKALNGAEISSDNTWVKIANGDTNGPASFVYQKSTFNLNKGFTVSYQCSCRQYTSNYSKQYVMGAKIGNVTVALKEYSTPVILVDGQVVATGEVVGKTDDKYDSVNNAIKWTEYVAYLHSSVGKGTEYKAIYDPETKTITFGAYYEGRALAEVATYTDTENKLFLKNAEFALYSYDMWDQYYDYTNVKLYGETEPEPDPSLVVGETLDKKWGGDQMNAADWEGHTQHITNGQFVAPNDQSSYTITTIKSYNLSNGFAFGGTLAMKNGYTNYYGEWCSASVGDGFDTLELRVKNDTTSSNPGDNTYTAVLLHNGEELATSDLTLIPNGEYELKYYNGKVSVTLGGVVLDWNLSSGGKSTSIAYDGAGLKNARLSLKLTNNWCPNGRKWSNVYLAPLSNGGVVTGDSRNIVVPALIMLFSSIAVAFVLTKKSVKS